MNYSEFRQRLNEYMDKLNSIEEAYVHLFTAIDELTYPFSKDVYGTTPYVDEYVDKNPDEYSWADNISEAEDSQLTQDWNMSFDVHYGIEEMEKDFETIRNIVEKYV